MSFPLILRPLQEFNSISFQSYENLLPFRHHRRKANEVRVVSQGKRGEEIIGEAERFAKRLKEELAQIENECDCVLLVSSAVISNAKLPDYTAHLSAKLGLSAEQQSNQLQQIEARLNSGIKR